jgi:hypothetical protein
MSRSTSGGPTCSGVDTVTVPHSPTNACVSTTVTTTTTAEPPSFLTTEDLTDISATAAVAR